MEGGGRGRTAGEALALALHVDAPRPNGPPARVRLSVQTAPPAAAEDAIELADAGELAVLALGPAEAGGAQAVVARFLQSVETDLTRAGYRVQSTAKIAAAYRARHAPVPTCRTAACLSQIAQAAGLASRSGWE